MSTSDSAAFMPLAVVGMACRLPGGITSPAELWAALLRGDDVITEVPADRWDLADFYDPEPGTPGRSVSRWGGFLDDVSGFDVGFFGFGEHEGAALDPQHRVLLEVAWEAVEHAGIAPAALAGTKTGVFVGQSHGDHTMTTLKAGTLDGPYGMIGASHAMASGRIAYALGVRAPGMTVDTACSSGLAAVHLAARSLHAGESDLVLAGGCMLMLEPEPTISMSGQHMLSPTGRCRAFDVAADGFVRSEGCSVVVLKRLADARRDGDRILAILRGTAANQDGRSETITMPSARAQTEVYRAALDAAGVDPRTVGMVEAHGTGTPVGDPLEYTSLSRVYGTDGTRCALSSVKATVGHTEAAAGVTGLITAVLALRHGVVPPNQHFTELNNQVRHLDTGLFIARVRTPWPIEPGVAPRRAVVSSFGISGTNVHAVLEQAPESAEHATTPEEPRTESLPLLVSATSAVELSRTAARIACWAERLPGTVGLEDLAYTLARRRGHRPVRASVHATSMAEFIEGVRAVQCGNAVGLDDRGPVWVFSGQGAQWAGMGTQLIRREPAFAACLAQVEALILAEAGFSVIEAMTGPTMVHGVQRVQPTLFAMQVSLAAAMRSRGVRPGAVIGHSLGEVAAAVVAGALSIEDGVRVICRRSRLCARLSGAGTMAMVELPVQSVRAQLAGVDEALATVCVLASPRSTVIGGEPGTVREFLQRWNADDVPASEIAVDFASHSPHVDPILGELKQELAELAPTTPEIPFYSATLDDPRAPAIFDASYWVDNLRNPVRFQAAVDAALADGHRVFGELSPHPLLIRAVEHIASVGDIPVVAAPAMRREQPLPHGLREFLCDLHTAGAAVDFSALYPAGRLVDVPLPTWTHKRMAKPARSSAHAGRVVTVHPLLGNHVRLPEHAESHVWQADVGTEALPWLADHVVNDVPVYPGAAYCEMALVAAREVFGAASEVRDLRFAELTLLDKHTMLTAVARVEMPGQARFEATTVHSGERTGQCTALLGPATVGEPSVLDVPDLLTAHSRRLDGADLRRHFGERGIRFGPAFTGLAAVHLAEGDGPSLIAELALPAPVRTRQAPFVVHPCLLDACFQAVAAHPLLSRAARMPMPVGVDRVAVHGPVARTRYCVVRVAGTGNGECAADLDLVDEHGVVLLVVRGFRMAVDTRENKLISERLTTLEWEERPFATTVQNRTSWLLITFTAHDSSSLARALARSGARCTDFTWSSNGERLAAVLSGTSFTGVVVLFPESTEDALPGREHVRSLVRIAQQLPDLPGDPPRLYVLSRGAMSVLPDDRVNLDHAGLRGALRVIGAEHPPLRPTQIDLAHEWTAVDVARELLSGSAEDESALRAGRRFVARLRNAPWTPQERRRIALDHEQQGYALEPESLEFTLLDRVPPAPGQVEIAVTASTMGLPGNGIAGVVSAVGSDVTGLHVGDRVVAMTGAHDRCWSRFRTLDRRVCAAIPAELPDEQAASLITCHTTALHCLQDIARVRPGDRVLIHSASAGAAIALARAAGAEVFATADNALRRQLLHEHGVTHVYDSHSIDLATQIRRDTNGHGVDIVLSTLSGPLLHAALPALAIGGCFLDARTKTSDDNTQLAVKSLGGNGAFHTVDIALLHATAPQIVGELLRRACDLVVAGTLPPPTCTTTAIERLKSQQHNDIVVLSSPETARSTVVVPPERVPVFRSDGAYIITGGLGGLGLFLARRMAKAGCGRIVLTSRSQPTHQALTAIEEMRAHGCDISVVPGDVADAAAVAEVVTGATATGLPLRGVLHAAAIVEDATLLSITDDLIDTNWAPKAEGAWNLHRATTGHPLDWFCVFSSAVALLGSPGQAAYAAASSWVDAFAQWRAEQGLPASVIAWDAWAEIGRAVFLAEREGRATIDPEEGAAVFEGVLRRARVHTGYLPVGGSPWLDALIARSPIAEYFRPPADAVRPTESAARLRSLPADQWPSVLRSTVAEQVALILGRTVDPDRSFSSHGMDSLGNLDLRTRIETAAGIRLTPKVILSNNTVRSLAQHLVDRMTTEPGT